MPRLHIFISCLMLAAVISCSRNSGLVYDTPAEGYTDAPVVGNGRIGALFAGPPSEEHILLLERTLSENDNTGRSVSSGKARVREVRSLLDDGRYEEAVAKCFAMMKAPLREREPSRHAGELVLSFTGPENVTDYGRYTETHDGVEVTVYTIDNVTYRHEAIASMTDDVIIIRLTASRPDMVRFRLSMNSPEMTSLTTTMDAEMTMTCEHAAHDSTSVPLSSCVTVKIIPDNGQCVKTDSTLEVTHADAVTVYVSAAVAPAHGPQPQSAAVSHARDILNKALLKRTDVAFEDHRNAFAALFGEMTLNAKVDLNSTITYGQRKESFGPGNDPSLPLLLFNYGRYLLLSSTPEGYSDGMSWPALYLADEPLFFPEALAELLVHQRGNYIHILPAVPQEWPAGSMKGLRLPGGIEITSLSWKNGLMSEMSLTSEREGICRLRTRVKITLQGSELIPIQLMDDMPDNDYLYELPVKPGAVTTILSVKTK